MSFLTFSGVEIEYWAKMGLTMKVKSGNFYYSLSQ